MPSALPAIAVDLRALVPAPTGIGVYTRSLLVELGRGGAGRYLGMAHRLPRGEAELAAAGVAVEVRPAPLGVLWQQLVLPRRLARGDVDLFWSPLMTLPRRCPVPAVVTVHDLTALLLPETHRLKVRLSIFPFLAASLEQAARVVAISEATAADLRFHFPACAPRLRVVPNGVDSAMRPAPPAEVAKIRAELGCPDGYLLYAGTLEPRKNLPLLLDAWEALARDEPATPPLLLAGDRGWRNARLLARVEALRPLGLRHLGHLDRDALVRLFQGARLFVYPSLYEGFGLPPLEAMACGVPVVAAAAASLPEVVGDAGLLVPPHEPAALASALRRLLSDPAFATDLAHRGQARAALFTWPRAARAMEQIFQEALT
jgi:glycosyltransferase involved in cell wall biosynthesis